MNLPLELNEGDEGNMKTQETGTTRRGRLRTYSHRITRGWAAGGTNQA